MSEFFEVAFQLSFAIFLVLYINYFVLQNAAAGFFPRRLWAFILRTSEKIASSIWILVVFLIRYCTFAFENVARAAMILPAMVIQALGFVVIIPLYFIGVFIRANHANPAVQPVAPAPALNRDMHRPENPGEERNLNDDATAATTSSGPSDPSTAATIAALEAELQNSQAEAKYYQEQSKLRQKSLDRLNDEHESLWELHLPCEGRRWGLKCKVKSLERATSAQALKIMELKRQLVDSEQNCGSLQETNQQQHAQIIDLWNDKQILQAKVQSLDERLQSANDTITKLERSDELLQSITNRMHAMSSSSVVQGLAVTAFIDSLVTSEDVTLADLGIDPAAFEESMKWAQATIATLQFPPTPASSVPTTVPTTESESSTRAVSGDSSATSLSTEQVAPNGESDTPDHASSSTPAANNSGPAPTPPPQQPPLTPGGTPVRLNAWQQFCLDRGRPFTLTAAQLASTQNRTSNESSVPNPPPAPTPTSPVLNRSGDPLPSLNDLVSSPRPEPMQTDSLYDISVIRQAKAATQAADAMVIDSEGEPSSDQGATILSIDDIRAAVRRVIENQVLDM